MNKEYVYWYAIGHRLKVIACGRIERHDWHPLRSRWQILWNLSILWCVHCVKVDDGIYTLWESATMTKKLDIHAVKTAVAADRKSALLNYRVVWVEPADH